MGEGLISKKVRENRDRAIKCLMTKDIVTLDNYLYSIREALQKLSSKEDLSGAERMDILKLLEMQVVEARKQMSRKRK